MWRAGAVLALLAAPAAADDWFMHPFGELRSYHQDWLAVCDGSGLGTCRAVHYVFEPGDDSFFGSARVAVYRLDAGGYAIEFWDQNARMQPWGPYRMRFDGAAVTLVDGDVVEGGADGLNVAQTIAVTDAALAQTMVALMRVADRLDLNMGGRDRRVSLLGLSSALDAIDTHIKTRDLTDDGADH